MGKQSQRIPRNCWVEILTSHAVRTPADAVLVFATAEQHMDQLTLGLQILDQFLKLFPSFDVVFDDHCGIGSIELAGRN